MEISKFARLAGLGLLAIGASIVQASIVGVAFAGEVTGQETVRISDLDLNKSADVARLYRRIRAAAESICGVDALTGTHLWSNSQRGCVEEAVGTAVARVHSAPLSAYRQQASAAHRAAAHPGSDGKDNLAGLTRRDRD